MHTTKREPGEMFTQRARAILYVAVLLMFSMTIVVGASVNEKSQKVKHISTPLVYNEVPSSEISQADHDLLTRQDERINQIIENQKRTNEWIAKATDKLSDHDVQFGEIKYYGYGMIGLVGVINAVGFSIVWKKK